MKDASSMSGVGTKPGVSDTVFAGLVRASGVLIVLIVGGLIAVLCSGGIHAFNAFGLHFLISKTWNPVSDVYGAAAPVFGTLVTTFLSVLLAVPFAFGVAFWLAEMAPAAIAEGVGTAVQLLAAVPSIIYGMWGFFVIVPFMARHVEPLLSHSLGHLPVIGMLFRGAPYGTGLLTGAIILAIMITPFMCAVMRDVFTSMPAVLRESAYGLGSTRWEVMRKVTLPWSKSAAIGGIVLGMGRAMGETMAVTFVIGNSNRINWSFFAPGNTIASLIALEFPESSAGSLKLASLLALGFILMTISFITLACSRMLLRSKPATR